MPRTGENIYKRKDGRWEAREIYEYGVNGKAKYKYFYGISRQKVKRKRQKWINEFAVGKQTTVHSSMYFKDMTQAWLNSTQLRVKESTYSRYFNQVKKRILPHLGKYKAVQISTELIEVLIRRFLKSKHESGFGLAPKTVEDILIIIKSILRFGKCHHHIEFGRIKIKKHNKKMITMPRKEQTKLCKYLIDNLSNVAAGILLSMRTGIRIGELCALRWGDVNFAESNVTINYTMQRIQLATVDSSGRKTKVVITEPKSRSSIRVIPIPKSLTAFLRKRKGNANEFVLTGNEKHMEPRSLHNHFKKYLKLANISDYNFHALRHSFATNYIERGFDAKSLSEILGHSSVKITLEKYVHSSVELKRKNIEKLDKIFFYSPSILPSVNCVNAV